MKIRVQYMAQIKQAASTNEEEFELATAPTLSQLIDAIVEKRPRLENLLRTSEGVPQPALLIFVDDEKIDPTHADPLPDGCEVTFLSPIAGG